MNKWEEDPYLLVQRCGADILASSGMQREKSYRQHGGMSCYDHSVLVACMSVRLARRFHLRVAQADMIRGALLHDYFLYDWHVPDPSHRLHGFTHAGCALRNAERDFDLTDVERDVIAKHMFPMNPHLPRCRESVLVTLADKLCASREVFAAALAPRGPGPADSR